MPCAGLREENETDAFQRTDARPFEQKSTLEEIFMEYNRFGNTIVARLDRGEEILDRLKAIALAEDIKLAGVQALGATDSFTVGVYNVETQQYKANEFSGSFEIVSLTGTVNTTATCI